MRIPRCYISQPLQAGTTVELPAETAHHLIHVLRLRELQALVLFNGEGGEYSARLERVGKKAVVANIEDHSDINRESPLRITLAQGISRGQKMDYTVQKAVELGITRLVPILDERTAVRLAGERLEKKLQHWRKIIIAACEQCGRNLLPDLSAPMRSRDWIDSDDTPLKLVLDPLAEAGFEELSCDEQALSLLIGSEGGLGADEIAAAGAAGFQAVRLGPRVLRTETAAVAALSVCQQRWGDL